LCQRHADRAFSNLEDVDWQNGVEEIFGMLFRLGSLRHKSMLPVADDELDEILASAPSPLSATDSSTSQPVGRFIYCRRHRRQKLQTPASEESPAQDRSAKSKADVVPPEASLDGQAKTAESETSEKAVEVSGVSRASEMSAMSTRRVHGLPIEVSDEIIAKPLRVSCRR
jgi:hypothetical protein